MLRFDEHVRNGLASSLRATIGQAPLICLYSTPEPATLSEVQDGLLCTFRLSNDWQDTVVDGESRTVGLPVTATAVDTGKVLSYRVFDSNGSACREQGGYWMEGDDTPEVDRQMLLDNTDIRKGQAVQLLEFTKIAPGK